MGVPLSTYARDTVAGGKLPAVTVPMLLWETLARRGDSHATTLPADVNRRPSLGDPIVYEVKKHGSGGEGEITIGRSDENDLQVDDESVSRTHASLRFEAGTGVWWLVDRGSSNGTFARGERLKPGVPFQLSDTEELVLGSTNLRFVSPLAFGRYLTAITGGKR